VGIGTSGTGFDREVFGDTDLKEALKKMDLQTAQQDSFGDYRGRLASSFRRFTRTAFYATRYWLS